MFRCFTEDLLVLVPTAPLGTGWVIVVLTPLNTVNNDSLGVVIIKSNLDRFGKVFIGDPLAIAEHNYLA